jgi:LuxR family maltose regulon positive regulatory protein
MSSNEFDDIEQRLQHAERLLNIPAEDLVIADRNEFSRLPAAVQTYRAALALVSGDPPRTVHHAEMALGLAAEDDHLSIASASALLGLAAWTDGELAAAHRGYRAATEHLERAGHIADVLGCSITLADLEITQGRLHDARRTFEHALALASGAPLRGIADMYVGLSRVSWEQGDLAAAAAYLRKADEVGDPAGLPQNPYRWRVMMAHLRQAQGDATTAIELLDEAERVYVGDFAPNVRPIASIRARLLAASGDLTRAVAWAREGGIAAGDELTYLGEYDHLTLARVLLAEHAATASDSVLADVTMLLAGILTAAEHGGRTGTVIETLALQALAEGAAAKIDSATDALARALQLAESEGFVRVFVDEGPPMRELLEDLVRHRPGSTFAQHLLHAFASSTAGTEASVGQRAAAEAGTADISPQALVDPLSSREIDVLRLLGSDLGGPDIARQLHVSLSTVRTHTQRIYAKLGVNNRRAAVRRAHQLDLFPRTAH